MVPKASEEEAFPMESSEQGGALRLQRCLLEALSYHCRPGARVMGASEIAVV